MAIGFAIRQNSLLPTLRVTVTDGKGVAVPWVAGTTTTVRADPCDAGGNLAGSTLIADRAAVAQNDGNGNLQLGVNWVTGDTATAGYYAFSWKPNIGGTSPQQEWPTGNGVNFIVHVEPTLA
jgi:hypothetical protein